MKVKLSYCVLYTNIHEEDWISIMAYNIRYPTEWSNDVLVKCNECRLEVIKNIELRKNFEFEEKYREAVLDFVILTLHTSFEDYDDYPKKTKCSVKNVLTEHGQFSGGEIEAVYNWCQYHGDCTREWDEYAEKSGYTFIDGVRYIIDKSFAIDPKNPLEEPINYSFPGFSCYVLKECGLCRQTLEEVKCEMCGELFYNCPDYVDSFNNLICPNCENTVIRSGVPLHHGRWCDSEPIVQRTSKDYLATYHTDCPKGVDGIGEMYPIGVWVEDARLIIHFQCASYGYEDALKYFVKSPALIQSVYTQNAGRNFIQLKKIHYRTYDLLEGTESKMLEFKSSFYGLNSITQPTPSTVKSAKNQILEETIAFLNTDGGVLLIGIEKNKNICGIEKDFEYISKTKKGHLSPADNFYLDFKDLVVTGIPNSECALPNINMSLEDLPTGECVCIIDVNKSKFPIFDKNKKIIVNAMGGKKAYSGKNYVKEHFGLDIDIENF